MAYDYALVHLHWTIPPAIFLTLLSYPLLTRVNVWQIAVMVVVAFTATVPWDSYLIKIGVWTYPPDAIVGPTWLGIPFEELFFFVIQTYITSLLTILMNKPLLHAQYLVQTKLTKTVSNAILAVLAGFWLLGCAMFLRGGNSTYMGILLAWALPFATIAWYFSGAFFLNLPTISVLGPILLPTLYLWLVDATALGRGTWSIESGTKLGIYLFWTFDIEEATFFLLTNVLIVFGIVGSSHALAIGQAFPAEFPELPPPMTAGVLARFLPTAQHDETRIEGIREAVGRLQKKSRSFYLASSAFSGRLRIDLILLYSYCRVADDLVDDAPKEEEARKWIARLQTFLDMRYGTSSTAAASEAETQAYVRKTFPVRYHSGLLLLPTNALPSKPLYELLDGFRMDLEFHKQLIRKGDRRFPIEDEKALSQYGAYVAGTVGQLCVALIAFHYNGGKPLEHQEELLDAAGSMGIALQYVNIARDIVTDTKIERVYLPTTWLKEEDLTPEAVLKDPTGPKIAKLRARLLSEAFQLYGDCRKTMDWLPREARGPMIAAVENYMEIGRVLTEKAEVGEPIPGRATVPFRRRLGVSLRALMFA